MRKLEFLLFYTTFLMFVIYISGLAGQTILSGTEGFDNLKNAPLDATNIFSTFSYFTALLSISTEYQMLFVVVIFPFLVGLIWLIVEWIRGI